MVWLSSQEGGTESVHIVTKGSRPKEKPPLGDVGLTPSSSFSSNILCPQGACFTFIIFHFPSSLPVLSYPISLSSPHFLSLLLLPFPHTSLPPPYFPHPYPSPKSSDAELGLKKSHFTELMALWELLFEYYLIQLWTEKVPPNHAWWFMTGNLINKVILELSFGKGRWPSRGCCELTSLPEALRLAHTLRKLQVVQNDQYQGHI